MSNTQKEIQQTIKKKSGSGDEGDLLSRKQSGKKKRYYHTIFRNWCKACGICSSFCPKNVIIRDENGEPRIEHPENCIGCRFCEIHCPDFAITIQESRDDSGGKNS